MNREEKFKEKLKEKFNGEVILLSQYTKNTDDCQFKCTVCNNTWTEAPRKILNRRRIKGCTHGKTTTVRKTLDEVKREVQEKTGGRFVLLATEYKNNKERVMFYDNLLKKEVSMSVKILLMKYSNEVNEENQKKFLNKFYSIKLNEEFSLVTPYYNSERSITFKHECGEEITKNPSTALDGLKCPICHKKYSKGIYAIINYLDNNKIKYKLEYTNDKLVYKNNVYFDLYIPKYKLFLEYDGSQHERGWKGNKKRLTLEQQRDEFKNNYAKENNMNLIRIKESDYKNIPTIMDSIFNKRKVPKNLFFIKRDKAQVKSL